MEGKYDFKKKIWGSIIIDKMDLLYFHFYENLVRFKWTFLHSSPAPWQQSPSSLHPFRQQLHHCQPVNSVGDVTSQWCSESQKTLFVSVTYSDGLFHLAQEAPRQTNSCVYFHFSLCRSLFLSLSLPFSLFFLVKLGATRRRWNTERSCSCCLIAASCCCVVLCIQACCSFLFKSPTHF